MRRRTRTRLLAGAVAPVMAFAVVAAVPAAPANASTTTRGNAYAAAAAVGAASGLTVQTQTTGLLGFLSPILSAVIDPLLSTLTSVIPSIVSQLTSAVIGSGWSANNAGTPVTAPTNGSYPNTCSSPWDSADCYGANLTVGTDSILSINLGTAQGYAAYDSTGFTGAARETNAGIHLLGVSLLSLGTVESTAHCDTTGTCTQTQDVQGLGLANNLVSVTLANGSNLLSATLGGLPIPVSGISIPLGLAGITATASLTGNLLTVQLGVSLDQLLSILSIGGLTGTPSASIMFTLTVGPGNLPASGSTGAWGLDLGLDLAASISINILGLAGVSVSIPTGIGGGNYGNLFDLKLAYSRANAPQASGGTWYPPGLI